MAEATLDHHAKRFACRSARGEQRLHAAFGAVVLLLSASAHAQGSPCEQLRSTLAARLHGDVRTYSLEAVPAGTPLPPGAKFIGTCEGGAKKIMYRKGNPAPLNMAAASVPVAAPKPSAPVVIAVPVKASAPVAAPVVKEPPRPAAPPLKPASSPASSPERIAKSIATSPSVPPSASLAPRAVDVATATLPMAATKPAPVTEAAADTDGAIDWPKPMRNDEPEGPSLTERATAFGREHWLWATGIVLLPLLLGIGAWVAHRRSYDASGLPRGPRL